MSKEIRMTQHEGRGPGLVRALSAHHCRIIWLATFVVFLSSAVAPAQSPTDPSMQSPMRHRGGHGKSNSDRADANAHHVYDTTGVSIVDRPPHGGQITRDMIYYFEVVYQPRETHLYIYGPSEEPLPSQTVQGEVALKPHYLEQTFRCSLKFVEPAPGEYPNHLVAATNVSGVPDGEMTVNFQLRNLFLPQRKQSSFTQNFAISKPPLVVSVVPLTDDDRPAIEHQQVCPVTGARLGAMGPPVKVLIGQQPLYLASQACVVKVQQEPEKYLAPAVQR